MWYRVEMVNSLGEGIPETDSDGDGLTDFYEKKLSLDADNADVDEDGLPDGWEVLTGLTAYGNDLTLDGNTGEIRSIFDLSIESELISFNASANQIILSPVLYQHLLLVNASIYLAQRSMMAFTQLSPLTLLVPQ